MSSLVEIKDSQSERLQKIASDTGVMPNVLLEEALELLFQQTDREKIRQEELAYLSQLEAEDDGSLRVQTRPPFKKEGLTITHSVPVETATPRRLK
jgi:predicted transcriptional regulator